MKGYFFVLLLLVFMSSNDFKCAVKGTDEDGGPVPKLKNQLAVPAIKFLICQS